MKVHHIVNDVCLEKGGAQRIVQELHVRLSEQGIDSQVVALCNSVGDLANATTLKNPTPYSYSSFFSVLKYVRQHCSGEDIIHVHLFPSLLYTAIAVRLLRWQGKLVCTEHNTSNRRREHPIGNLIDQLIYPMYQRIYCISQGTYNAFDSWMPTQKGKLQVLENGALLSRSTFLKREKKETLIIASAGRLHRQKNYAVAIRAMLLLDNTCNIEYRIAGTGPEEASLKALTAELNLGDKIKFCGYVEDIAHFFNEADIFLMPSRWEGFGLAAVEAMNAGLPVIVSRVTGIQEIVDTPEPCGILVPPDSPSAIAKSISTLTDYSIRLSLGQKAFERSLDFSAEQMSQKYIDEYRQLTQ